MKSGRKSKLNEESTIVPNKSTNDALAANYDFVFDFKDFTGFASIWKFLLL